MTYKLKANFKKNPLKSSWTVGTFKTQKGAKIARTVRQKQTNKSKPNKQLKYRVAK